MNQTKRLYRSETNYIIAGVCGGLGEYFDIDATLIRIIFVLATIFGGSGLFIYILLWILLPKRSHANDNTDTDTVVKENVREIKDKVKKVSEEMHNNMQDRVASQENSSKDSNWFAYFLIAVGSVILLSKLGLIRLDLVWPLLLIGLGLLILFK